MRNQRTQRHGEQNLSSGSNLTLNHINDNNSDKSIDSRLRYFTGRISWS